MRALHCLQAVWEQWLSPVDGLRRPLYLTRPPEWDAKAKRPKAKVKATGKTRVCAKSEGQVFDPSYNLETTRNCYQRRTGLSVKDGGVSGKQFSFKGKADQEAARKKAEA